VVEEMREPGRQVPADVAVEACRALVERDDAEVNVRTALG
jgi:hypothetical protein